jgi:signal transduction histidine kinase
MTEVVPDMSDSPAELPVAPKLEELVQHAHAVDHLATLEEIHQKFRQLKVDYFAVMRDGLVLGLCARSHIGFILGSRFGFALYSNSTVHTALVENPVIVRASISPHELLAGAFARRGDAFYDDVVLVDGADRLLGLISTEALVNLQSRLMAGQMERLVRQHDVLHEQNLELFRTNHALRQSRGLYHGLFESNALGVAMLDPAGNIQACNRRLAELLNLAEGEVAATALMARVGERERGAFLQMLQRHERDGAEADGATRREFLLQVPGRGARHFRVTTGWIPETGQVCACLDDVTDQRAMEQMMLRKEKQNLLDTLVGGIAHELNNKLTPVLGFADLLKSQADPAVAGYAASIRQSALEAAGIIRQLLQLAKPARGRLQRTDLRTVVEESLVMLSFQLRESRCAVAVKLPPAPVPVRADAAQLKQIVMNLVLNALQAASGRPEPQVVITVELHHRQGRVIVADNGPGIAPEHLGRVFDPFFTTKDPDKGTGLGLSITQSLVRQHDGDITAESVPGQGARLTVSLPLDATPEQPLLLDEPAGPAAAAAPAAVSRARVLIVEDEEIVRILLQEVLRRQGVGRITLAFNGAEGLAALAVADYDLVLSDIRMPVMNGTELYLRARESRPDLARRFVFVTGYPGGTLLEKEIAGWGVPLLCKPFTPESLGDICRPFLEMVGVGGTLP